VKALPRVFIAHNFEILDDKTILQRLMDKNFNPRQTLLLEKDPGVVLDQKAAVDQVSVDEQAYFQNRVVLKTLSDSDGLLYLSDNYYPGWKAYIDGQETKIYRADYTFRAVVLPKGNHVVTFLFEPKSFKIGAILSLAALTVLGGLLVYERAKKSIRTPRTHSAGLL